MTSVTLAVLGLSAVLLAAGYCALTPVLAGRTPLAWASYAGVALLVGAGLVGTLVFMAAIAGARVSLPAFAICAGVVATAGLLAARRWRLPASTPTPPPSSPLEEAVAIVAGFAAAAVALLGAIGASRSSPWLDDAWGIWLPKGLALWHHGLDARLFVPNGEFVTFGVPDYPLWWSVVSSLNVQAAGDVDVRVMCAQLALLTVGFVGAVARLAWGYVRPTVLAAGLALLVLSPELWRHVQGGVADLPLALYLALGVLAGALWLKSRAPFHLLLGGFALAVALQVKTEALPEVAALVVVGTLFARRLAWTGLALLAALPWLLWRWIEDVPSRAKLDFTRTDRLPDAVRAVSEHLFDPTEWLVLVPLVIVLALIARRPKALLVPAALVAVLLVAYWIDRDEIGYVLATSAYRVIDPVVLSAAVLIPLLAESFLQQREPLREDRALVGEPRDDRRVVQQH
jgi:hypothetical protein